ncbi:MAG: hypothetical protein HY047_10015, partial [Acidobacteria bacterium]|nr:hypothetical protein [Acidobacteriota bacterium]
MFSAIRTRLTLSLKSLRVRLTFWYLLTLGATLAVFATFLLVVRARTLRDAFDADLEVRAHRFASDLRPDLFSLDVRETLASDPRAMAAPLRVGTAAGLTIFRAPSFPELNWTGEREAA